MSDVRRLTFLFDVDNTLLDNDAAKDEIARRLLQLMDPAECDRFWQCYEAVRAETSVVSFPLTLWRFHHERVRPRNERDRQLRFALADLLMTFPYDQFVFAGALAAIDHVRSLGEVAVLSDGDPAFQPSKIIRSGLGRAVEGHILVYAHKEEHLDEVVAVFPADQYVLVEDRPSVIAKVQAEIPAPLLTIQVRQGKYASEHPDGWSGGDITLPSIADVAALPAERFRQPD